MKKLVDRISAELADTMAMCGAYSLSEISRDMLYFRRIDGRRTKRIHQLMRAFEGR